jgi:uncharacterized protein
MIIVIHFNDNSIKATYRWHKLILNRIIAGSGPKKWEFRLNLCYNHLMLVTPLSPPSFLTEDLEAIQTLAKAHHVVSLEVFGSAVTGQMNDSSDIDLLVTFAALEPIEYSRYYFAFKHGLEDLLGRNVDLIELETLDNPYFLKAIEPERIIIYAA